MRESPEGTHVKHTRACTHTHTRTYLYVGQSSSSYSRIQESGVHPVFRKLRPLSPFPGISRPRTVFSFWLQCSAISQLFFCFVLVHRPALNVRLSAFLQSESSLSGCTAWGALSLLAKSVFPDNIYATSLPSCVLSGRYMLT